MTATQEGLPGDGHFLIQPASYLQYGQAAYPANLSFGQGVSPKGRLLLSTQSADAEGKRTEVPTFPTSVPNSCNLGLVLILFPNLSLKFRLPPD